MKWNDVTLNQFLELQQIMNIEDDTDKMLSIAELFFGEEKTYTVRWLDEDETVLETDLNVKEGSVPTYNGEEPHKEGFTFNGWTPEVGKVYKDIDYKATYIEIGKTYTVTWVNYNDTVLE